MKLKVRSTPRFLSSIFAGTGTAVRKDALATYVDLNYSLLQPLTSFDPSTKQIAINDSITGLWNQTTLSNLLALSGYVATSVTPLTIGLGSVSFTTQAGLAYRPGARVRASHAADTSKYMEGLVTSYSGTTLTVSISKVSGAGTFSDWNLNIAGDPGTGDMLSVNNGLDFANLPATLNNLGGVSFANAQTLTSAQQLQARKNIGVVSGRGEINILDFGGVGDGATDNTAAFNAAWAALGTYGGCIYFPAGKYVFNSAIAKTLPASQFSIAIRGDGSNSTTLHWPLANGGITLTQGIESNTFHLRDLTLTTTQINSGVAFKVIGKGADNGSYWQSDIINVVIAGDDIGLSIPTLHYWNVCLYNHAWPSVYIANTNTWGPHQAPGGAGGGTGLIYEGDIPTAQYNVLLNVVASSFNNHVNGWILGSYWQGVTCTLCNFNGQLGNSAITANGTSGIQVLLEISNCQFDTGNGAIILSSAVDNVTITGNSIGVLTNNGIGASIAAGQTFIFTNNILAPSGTLTGTYGLVYGGANAIVQGNVFHNIVNGVNLQASSSAVNVSQNIYPGVTTQVINNGTGNSVGLATK